MKLCAKCGEGKPLAEFTKDRSRPDGLNLSCRECGKDYRAANADRISARKKASYAVNSDAVKQRARAYYAANAEAVKAQKRKTGNLKIRYGLTEDDYYQILESQFGKCANPGCSNEPSSGQRLNVDHDHSCCPNSRTCGKCIRGLLCPTCNSALGYLNDNVNRLQGLIDYLQQPKKNTNSLAAQPF